MKGSEGSGTAAPRPQWRSTHGPRGRASGAAATDRTSPTGQGIPWRLLDVVVVLTVISVGLVLTRAIMNVRAVAALEPSARVVVRGAVLAALFCLQLATLAVLCRAHRSRLRDAVLGGWLQRPVGRIAGDVALVLVLLVVTRLASYAWGALARALGWDPPPAGALSAVFGAGAPGLALSVAALVVLGPAVEELAFRGVVLQALRPRFGERTAVAVSALVFALYHATAWTFVPLVVLGVSLGWLALRRESLAPAIALHALYNGVVITAAYWLEA